ncbi:hypothetical protein MNV49_002314 [Pseudohyphozyma bogoriensis]|nr:hypothetical protein MNV49_002314 [Pseudohyphozyma bogoriensis]
MSPKLDLDEIHRFACSIAIEAGSYLRDVTLARAGFGGTEDEDVLLGTAEKENAADIVTKADVEAERIISDAIRERYPGHQIIGEESYSAGQEKRFLLTDDPTWIIDPLDGTVNFVHVFPTCCVSVGFCVNKQPVVGAIFAPLLSGLHPTNATGTLYSAFSSGGAWSTPIALPFTPSSLLPPSPPITLRSRPSPFPHSVPLPYLPPTPIPPSAPSGGLFLAEWGKSRDPAQGGTLDRKVETFKNFAAEKGSRGGLGGMVHGVRSLGSATLDCVYVATGAVDVFWEAGCWEWDICAGACLILESGGLFVPSQPPLPTSDISTTPILPADLGSRLYLGIRPARDTEGETAREQQERLVREVWRRGEWMEYKRPV